MLIVRAVNNLFVNERNRFRPDISQLSRAGTGKSPIMKTLFNKQNMGSAALGLGLLLAQSVFGQTNLKFTAVAATDEKAIRLTWASQSNEVYQVQCADSLIDTNTGTTTWQTLYDDYPSQGTSTFWLDTGNYNLVPQILHPKNMPMRFYRILDRGTDGLAYDEPTVSIVTPTNGFIASGSLTITVAASTDQSGGVDSKLYVDGQEMWPSDDGSNYVINTCEWGNGSHILFATAKSLSAPSGGPVNTPAALVGHAVSPFVPVTFSNLVTRISFSEPFFNPDAGQTQQVSAVFAANCDWTLNIRDIYSNAVRTVTGSGTFLLFNWDGNGNGGTNIPAGVYYYYISAQTNGLAPQGLIESGSALSRASLSAPEPTELFAVPTNGSEDVVPLALYPQGFDTNSLIIFRATQSQVDSLYSGDAETDVAMNGDSSVSPMDSGTANYSGASSQSVPPAPSRPPTAPADRVAGSFGYGYQTYSAVGTGYYQPSLPRNKTGLGYITIEAHGTADPPKYYALAKADDATLLFASEMVQGGWNPQIRKDNDNLRIGDLRGSGSPFNNVNFAYIQIHGASGDTIDYTVGNCTQMYFPIASGTGAQYLRMSEMNFGGAGSNGLKWVALMACRSLYPQNWTSMQSQNVFPYNSNLHMILGTATDDNVETSVGSNFAHYMTKGRPGGDPLNGHQLGPMSIHDAWYQAAIDAYYYKGTVQGVPYSVNPMVFATAYDNNCYYDTLQTNYPPSGGTWGKDTRQVYP